MKKHIKRLAAMLLSCLLILGSLPTAVFASGTPDTAEDGSYILRTADDLMWFAAEVMNGENAIDAQLGADIDLTGEDWIPIGGDSGYEGTFNGNGFTVTLDINADESYEYSVIGLFGYLYDATVKNLKTDGQITVTNENYPFIGAIAGAGYDATIVNCANYATITAETEGLYGGGILGGDEGTSTTITMCANHGTINAEGLSSVGGIIGNASGMVKLNNCYNSGSVRGGSGYTGGLVGDGEFRISGSYSSAGLEEWGAPGNLSTNETVSGGICGDIAGYVSGARAIKNSLCQTDIIVGSNSIYIDEFENCKHLCDCDTVEEMLEILNTDCTEPAFIVDDGFNGGWLAFAWELRGGSTPDENDKALTEAKEQALKEIEDLYSDGILEKTYEESDREKVKNYRDKAIETINAAKEPDTVTAALKALKADIASVPTVSDRLADYKKLAAAEVEKAYFYEEVTQYSTRSFGYKADLLKIIAKAGQLGLRHDKKDELLRILEADAKMLEEQKNSGISAINASLSKNDVDTAKSNAITAMAQTVKTAADRTVDSGVAYKWDGETKQMPKGNGTSSDPYKIGTAAELAWFADSVNSGNKSISAELIADIDLNNNPWTPIAVRSSSDSAYSGTFNGNGYSVQGLYVRVTKESGGFLGGLFGYIGRNGTVSSVSVSGLIKQELGNEYLRGEEPKKYAAGGIAGRTDGIIYDCETSVSLTNGEKYSNCNYLGGIAGLQSDGIIEKCVSFAVLCKNGSANFQTMFGGVTGSTCGNSLIRYTDSYADIDLGENVLGNIGGITGNLADTAQIRECRSYAKVNHGCVVVGTVSGQAGLSYIISDGKATGENSIMTTPGAGIAGTVNTTGTLSYLYNKSECVYGLINTFLNGTVTYARSSASAGLWGKVDIQHTVTDDCLKVSDTGSFVGTASDGELGKAKLDAAVKLLGKIKSKTDSVYGTQSDKYNAVILECLRKTELAASINEINAALAELNGSLSKVPTQLENETKEVLYSFAAYLSERVYDERGSEIMEKLLSKATAEVKSASTVKELTTIKEKYLGTDKKPGLFETSCDTYNTKAKNELYNEFIYGKTYSETDSALIYGVFETRSVRLDRAKSVDEIETIFAEARKALHDLTENKKETGKEPDINAVKRAAINAAKESAQKELYTFAEEIKSHVEEIQLSADGKNYTDGFTNALKTVYENFAAQADSAAKADFSKSETFADIEDKTASVKSEITRLGTAAERLMKTLITRAEESSDKAWDGKTLSEPKCENDIYLISNGSELAWLAKTVNEDSSRKFNAVLTEDIDLAYHEWTPIGQTPYGGKGFNGTFKGNGHKIKGLFISEHNEHGYYGLFGSIRGNSSVTDIDVYGIIEINGLEQKEYVGGIAASCFSSTLKNCRSYIDIRIGNTSYNGYYVPCVGGIIGLGELVSSNVLQITDCSFNGTVTVTGTRNNRELEGIGGIIGRTTGLTEITRCVNYGTVDTDKARGTAGIVGVINSYEANVKISECANLGDISNDPSGIMDSKGGTGGIVGVVLTKYAKIENCFNTGDIYASQLAGGILGGESSSYAYGSSTSGSSELFVENVYNAGKLIGPNNQSSNKIGSIAGYPLDGEYKDCIYSLNGTAQSPFGWIGSKGYSVSTVTEKELDRKFADGEKTIKSIAGLNKGYPLFIYQISDSGIRSDIAEFLRGYYSYEIKTFASDAQKTTITEALERDIAIITTESLADKIIAAYNDAMNVMDKQKLSESAVASALESLEKKAAAFSETYPKYADKTDELKKTYESLIKNAQSPADSDILLDRFDAAVVGLLIDAVKIIDADASADDAAEIKSDIETARAAYDALSDAKKVLVSNFVKLHSAESAFAAWENTYEANKKVADNVSELIKAIGTVTLDSRQDIEDAENAYNALTEKQKGLVDESVRKILENAVEQYNELVKKYNSDIDAARNAAEKAAAIGKITLDSKKAIEDAQKAYDALTDEQKAMLPDSVSETLKKAADIYAELEKEYIADKDAADSVINLINSVGNVTLDSKTKIENARAAYDSLSDKQKSMISAETLTVLVNAETQYIALVKASEATTQVPASEEEQTTQPNAPTENATENTTESADMCEESTRSESNSGGGKNNTPVSERKAETTAGETTAEDTVHETEAATEKPTADAANESTTAADDDKTPVKFDGSIILIIVGIIAAIAIAAVLIWWFTASKKKKRR